MPPMRGSAGSTTPVERLALIEVLTREAWVLAGLDIPTYARHEAPVSVKPLRKAGPGEGRAA